MGVTDGDTISVMRDGKAEKVRLSAIDCPEDGQAYGTKAKSCTSALVFGKQVTVRVTDKDRYGRLVGEVVLADGTSIQREILKAGMAWWYRRYSTDTSLGDIEAEARASKRGLWAEASPVAPWDYRRGQRTSGELADRGERNEAQSTQPTPPPLARETGPAPSSNLEATVYVTKTGTKYHCAGCQYLRQSLIPIALADAQKSYGPCSVCRPPTSIAGATATAEQTPAVSLPPSPPPQPSTSSSGSDRVNVRGYYRKDGTYVRPHTRSRPSR